MSEHTPGPWEVRVTKFFNVPDDRQYLVVGTDLESICRMIASEGPEMQAQAMPDARLIAAAPLMYEALEGLMKNPSIDLGDLVYQVKENECEGWDGPNVVAWGEAVQKARAALQAAKGGGDNGK